MPVESSKVENTKNESPNKNPPRRHIICTKEYTDETQEHASLYSDFEDAEQTDIFLDLDDEPQDGSLKGNTSASGSTCPQDFYDSDADGL